MGSFIQFIGLETGNFDLGQNLTSFLPCHRHLEGSQMDVIHLSHFLLVPLNIAKKNIYLTLDHIQVPREKQQHWQDEDGGGGGGEEGGGGGGGDGHHQDRRK